MTRDLSILENQIKHGEMNGSNEAVMEALLTNIGDHHKRMFMAELWLRNISKADFLEIL